MNMYSKYLYVILALPVLLALSCGDDEDPITITIDNPTVALDFDENPQAGQIITTISATTNRGTLTYEIANETPSNGATEINSSGDLIVADASEFDFEKHSPAVLVITVKVSNGDASETATVTISLRDLPDEVNTNDESVTMDENPNNGQLVVTMSATVDTGTPSFSISSQTPARTFSIDASSGDITVADFANLDFETNPTLTLVVTASNGSGSDDATVTVTLNNLLETLTTQDETLTIDENPTANQQLVTVTGITDMGSPGFSVQSESVPGAFAINATSGVLTVADPSKFDYETNPTLTATISVTNTPLEETALITVNLNDLTELNWSEANSNVGFGGVYDHQIVDFNNQLWSIGGIRGTSRIDEIWSSADGVTWTQVNPVGSVFSPRNGHQAVVFNSKIWVIGGFTDGGRSAEIWSSSNGSSWTLENITGPVFSGRSDHAVTVYDSKMWLTGGNDGAFQNDVWSSSNGTTWTLISPSGSIFTARMGHTLNVVGNKLMLIAGADLNSQQLMQQKNDIWTSTDGLNWTEVSVTGNIFSERWIHGSSVYNNRIWVIGGSDGNGDRNNEVWSSQDGTTWTETTATPVFDIRDNMAVFTFNNLIWVSGGSNNNGVLSDIWKSN